MYYLYAFTAAACLVSLVADPRKTLRAMKTAAARFCRILPAFLVMLVLVSILLGVVSDRLVTRWLAGRNVWKGMGVGSVLGSVTLMPGFIAFPLAGILRSQGVPYMVISAFTTTLMMVGVVTYPVEKEYFGARVTVLRNLMSFFIALAVAAVTGFVFGEIGP